MKNILVTGISKGLGLEIKETLLKAGYNVFGVSRSFEEPYSVDGQDNSFEHIQYDLSNVDEIKDELFTKKLLHQIPIHGYINNAAFAYDDIITNLNYQRLEEMYRVNVFSPMMISKFVLRNMLLHNVKRSIIHISSISVHTGYKGLAMYASSKGALEAFSKNTAREWGQRGIRSNCIVAGFMETSMSNTLDREQKDRIYKRTSLKKPTSLKSVAKMAEFLLSSDSESITGQNLFVDSGTI